MGAATTPLHILVTAHRPHIGARVYGEARKGSCLLCLRHLCLPCLHHVRHALHRPTQIAAAFTLVHSTHVSGANCTAPHRTALHCPAVIAAAFTLMCVACRGPAAHHPLSSTCICSTSTCTAATPSATGSAAWMLQSSWTVDRRLHGHGPASHSCCKLLALS